MTRDEIAYALYELLREGNLVDDERFDIRLLYEFIKTKRAEYLRRRANVGEYMSENNKQEYSVPISQLKITEPFYFAQSTDEVPEPMTSKYGFQISEVANSDIFESTPFTVVNPWHIRHAGNGIFNANEVYTTYRDNRLVFKTRRTSFRTVTSIVIRAIFESPEDVPGFNADVDDYPIDLNIFEYIKDQVIDRDFKTFLNGQADEVNDGDGDIKT